MLSTTTFVAAPEWGERLRTCGLDSLKGVYGFSGGELIKQSSSADLRRVEIGHGAEARTVYIKKYWIARPRQIWSGLFRGVVFGSSKASREFMNLRRLREWGLDAPEAVAFGQERRAGVVTRSLLISDGIPDPMPLHLAIVRWLPSQAADARRAWKAELIRRLAVYTRKMHEHQFVHHDYFWRNIILTGTSLGRFSLIDSHKGGLWAPGFGQRARAKDLATLDAPAPGFFRRTERLRFLLLYLGKKRLSREDKQFARLILRTAAPLRERQARRAHEAGG